MNRLPRKVPALVGVVAVVAVATTVAIGLLRSEHAPGEQGPARSFGQPSSAAIPDSSSAAGVTVPDVLGQTAMEAGATLSRVGLTIGDADPTPGPLGVVVGTSPAEDQIVDAGTPVTLLIGASEERLDTGS